MKAARRSPPPAHPKRRAAVVPQWLWTAFVAFVIGAATVAVYAQVSSFKFLRYDDPEYVVQNRMVHHGVTPGTIRWAFTTGHAANWHPLTWISHMLDWRLFGKNPGPHHLMNVAFHVATSLLLLLAFVRMTGALWPSALVAAVFALHPLHVESVAWVSERKDVLSGLFWMLTLLAYTTYVRRPRAWSYLLTLVVYALGLMTKPMLVTLPLVLLLLDVWPLRRWNLAGANRTAATSPSPTTVPARRLLIEKLPMMALAIASSVVTFLVQRAGSAATTTVVTPLVARFLNAAVSYATYVLKTLCPVHLAPFYPWRAAAAWQVALALALLVTMSVLAVRWWRPRPYVAIGWCWFLGTLVPVIGLVQVGRQALADRYMYVPQIGLSIIAAWGLVEIASTPGRRWIVAGGTLLAIALLAIAGERQAHHWREGLPLFEYAVKAVPGNYEAETLLGIEWHVQGDLPQALAHYEESFRIAPNYYLTRSNLGLCLAEMGRVAEAIPHLREAIRLNPRFGDAHRHLGLAHAETGQFDEAERELREAIRLSPGDGIAYYFLGKLMLQRGSIAEGRAAYETAVRVRPDYMPAQIALQELRLQGAFDSARGGSAPGTEAPPVPAPSSP